VVLQLGLSVVWTFCALLGCIVNASFMDRVGRVKLLGKCYTMFQFISFTNNLAC